MTYQDPRYRDPEYRSKWAAAHLEKQRQYSATNLERHREANRQRASRYYYANREDRKAKARAYYAEHREEQRASTIARRFGLTVADFQTLRAAQNDRCGICGLNVPLSIDHDHETGRVRGLLCATCNFMVGHGKDDPELLRAAARYLEGIRNA